MDEITIFLSYRLMKAKEKQFLKAFSVKMRIKRYSLNLSQLELAEKVDCSLNALGRIERAQADPSLTMVFRIALALDLSIKDLMPD